MSTRFFSDEEIERLRLWPAEVGRNELIRFVGLGNSSDGRLGAASSRAWLSSSTSSRASGGQAATAMEKAFNAGAEAILAHSDSPIPRANDSHAFQRLPARRWPAFHSSIVAIVNRPSTIRGQRVAVVWCRRS